MVESHRNIKGWGVSEGSRNEGSVWMNGGRVKKRKDGRSEGESEQGRMGRG